MHRTRSGRRASRGRRPSRPYAIDDGERLLLFDPLAVPSEIEERAADRKPVIVLTAPWHERDTQSLLERLDAPVYAPPPDTAEDLMERFGITREQAGEGSPDLAWLRAGDRYEAHFYTPADRPMGAEVFPGRVDNDVWVPKTRFPCKSAHSRKAIRVLALARSGLRQTDAWIEACSSDSSAASSTFPSRRSCRGRRW
jgi:hypothetical protein